MDFISFIQYESVKNNLKPQKTEKLDETVELRKSLKPKKNK